MTKKTEGLKSISLEIENFKNIKSRIVHMNGKSMLFLGGNGKGKSSLIQAMKCGMDVKEVPSEPITKGEEKATVTHKIAGEINGIHEEYTIEMFFTEKNKKGRVILYNKDGEKLNAPKELIKTLIGNVSFDVSQFIHDTNAKKLELVKKVSEVGKEVDLINMDIAAKKESLKYKKQRAEELEGALNNHEFTDKEVMQRYMEPKDTSAINEKYQAVSKAQGDWDGVKVKLDGFKKDSESYKLRKDSLELEVKRLQEQIEDRKKEISMVDDKIQMVSQNIQRGEEWIANTPRPTMDGVMAEMNEATEHNKMHERLKMLSSQQKEMISAREEVEKLKTEVESLENKRADVFKKSKLKVPGLTFDNDGLYIDGLPLEEGQINTQRVWDIGVDLAMAINPTYKVIFLGDGSLFDKDHLAATVKRIEEAGYMAVVELVDREGGELETEYFEEEVK